MDPRFIEQRFQAIEKQLQSILNQNEMVLKENARLVGDLRKSQERERNTSEMFMVVISFIANIMGINFYQPNGSSTNNPSMIHNSANSQSDRQSELDPMSPSRTDS